jgi:hypothetical protein
MALSLTSFSASLVPFLTCLAIFFAFVPSVTVGSREKTSFGAASFA